MPVAWMVRVCVLWEEWGGGGENVEVKNPGDFSETRS